MLFTSMDSAQHVTCPRSRTMEMELGEITRASVQSRACPWWWWYWV